MTAVPFLDLKAAYQEVKFDIDEAVERSINSGWYIGGPEVDEFENEFAKYCGANHCVVVGNGLEALHLALRAMGIGPGDEVIVPSHTYIATWLAVSHCGAKPVAVEPIEGTYNIDPLRIEAAITSRTKAIIPVHLYGQPADIAPIVSLPREKGLRVLEDAAQAHGAKYEGRRIGAHGDVVAWSFYPGKNLVALVDAGAITTNDAVLSTQFVAGLLGEGLEVLYRTRIGGDDPQHLPGLHIGQLLLGAQNRQRAIQAAGIQLFVKIHLSSSHLVEKYLV